MAKSSPFNSNKADLGTADTGYSKVMVDDILRDSQFPTQCPCFVCGQPSQYRIMPKNPLALTAEIQKGLYICIYHLQIGTIDPDKYGIRELI